MSYLSLIFPSAVKEFSSLFRLSLSYVKMKWCWFSLSAFTMSPRPVSILASTAHLFFSLSHSYASALWLALSRYLISFVLIPCLSPVLHFSLTLARSLLYHTLILCDVKLITLPLFLSVSLPLSVPPWCESDYGGWRIGRFAVCMCACMWESWCWHIERQVKGEAPGVGTDGGVSVPSLISSI